MRQLVPLQQFRGRRVPGTLTLAVTNLLASTILFDPTSMTASPVHQVALAIMPPPAWGVSFLVAGVGLVVAAITRLSFLLHVFGAVSIGAWVAMSSSAIISDIASPDVQLSGIAQALFVWMLFGPLAMILVPLIAERLERRP